ncbi:MAG TPA: sulfatase [Longimicrobiales bacterium]|nr:sulfatase [Longimicrobiales bacterium]
MAFAAVTFGRRSALEARLGRLLQKGRAVDGSRILALALLLGVTFGFAEFVVWKVRYLFDHQFLHGSNPDTIWAAPLVLGTIALGVALPLALVARRAGGVSAEFVVTVIGLIGWFAVLRGMRTGIHALPAVILAGGLAVVSGRLMVRAGLPFHGRLTRWAAIACGVVLVLGTVMTGGRAVWPRLVAGSLPVAPAGSPNVIVIILDTVRAESMSLYGYERPTTPNLVAIGERGLVFDLAIAPAPWTLPSHATMFTGLPPSEHGADWRTPLPDDIPTLASVLRDRGYLTAGFTANIGYATRASGLSNGFIRYADYGLNVRSIVGAEWYGTRVLRLLARVLDDSRFTRVPAPEISRAALDWIDGADRPYFVFLNYFDAHGPYELRDGFAGMLDLPANDSVLDASGQWTTRPERIANARDRYDTSLAYLDDQIGRLFQELERRGQLDRTLVVITSDHGELFGEHGLNDHGNSLLDPLLRVPLIMVGPGLDRNPGRIDEVSPLSDLPATVAAFAGFRNNPFPGESLLDARPEEATHDRYALSQVTPEIGVVPEGPLRNGAATAITDNVHKLIRYDNGRYELYDLRLDPAESRNLAGATRVPELARSMSERIDSILDVIEPKRTVGDEMQPPYRR